MHTLSLGDCRSVPPIAYRNPLLEVGIATSAKRYRPGVGPSSGTRAGTLVFHAVSVFGSNFSTDVSSWPPFVMPPAT